MNYIFAYFVNRFPISSLGEFETNLAKKLEFNGMINTMEFITALESARMLKYTKTTQLDYDTSTFDDLEPAMFSIDMFETIYFSLKSETFQILNFGTPLTILQKDNRISEIEYIGRLYKDEDVH